MTYFQALGLNGQKLLGVPVVVQPSQAEKNRMGNYNDHRTKEKGPMRLYVGSLHFNITKDMLEEIFKSYGRIQSIELIMDPETGRSKGYGFVTVSNTFWSLKRDNCDSYAFAFSMLKLRMPKKHWNS